MCMHVCLCVRGLEKTKRLFHDPVNKKSQCAGILDQQIKRTVTQETRHAKTQKTCSLCDKLSYIYIGLANKKDCHIANKESKDPAKRTVT